MKLLIDANILLDVLQNREPHVQASSVVWKLCETEKAKGYVSALTFANLVYDIVNIGLHFILKNVRPYAASCSEA